MWISGIYVDQPISCHWSQDQTDYSYMAGQSQGVKPPFGNGSPLWPLSPASSESEPMWL